MRELTIEEIKKELSDAIREAYDMSIYEFSKSDVPEELGINGKSLPTFLASGGSTSFKTYRKLYELLGMGVLKKEVEVIRTTKFFIA